jgi:NAD(P)-dependent dehydrogenase (short-subunit alcohol dehydrogenase family)
VIVDDERGVGEELARALAREEQDVVRLSRDQRPRTEEQASEFAARLRDRGGVKALIHLAALAEPRPAYGALSELLLLTQALRAQLETAAAAGGAVILGTTGLGGAFGVGGISQDGAASQGALHGFLKTAALEFRGVRVKSIDLSEAPRRQAARLLFAELAAADGLVEAGYRDGERTQLALAPAPLDDRPVVEPLDEECVLLVTGGARGITSQVALTLAERYRPMLVLVGRTPVEEEGPAIAALSELAELRQAMIEQRKREHKALTPALVEQDCRRILRAREVRENLRCLRDVGARVDYRICDVSDQTAFAELIGSVYERHGRIDGVVHGAGVIEDKLIRDKSRDSLERVIATKAGAAQTLAERLRPDSLRFLVLFGSVAGRFGSRGQADYAAANEVLARLAHELDRRWPARVVAVDWGPWRAAGMVSPELEREFARRGVPLIEVERGCRLLDEELSRGRKGEAEVVIGAAVALAGDEGGPSDAVPVAELAQLPLLAGASEVARVFDPSARAENCLHGRYTLDPNRDRYLGDHRIDGKPVLPFAVAMELMAEVAVAANPGRDVAGLGEIRLLDGVALADGQPTSIRIEATPRAGADEVEVAITPADRGRAHYRARVQLRAPAGPRDRRGPDADAPAPPPLADPKRFPIGIEEAYRDLLFHGPLFQGIVAIEGMDELGAASLLRPSQPGRCVAGADGLRWLLDPVLLDSALQIQVLWARLQWDVTLLPAEIGGYAQTSPATSAAPVRHELRIRAASDPPLCHADHWFYGSDGRLLGQLQDVVGVGTQTLNRLAGARP